MAATRFHAQFIDITTLHGIIAVSNTNTVGQFPVLRFRRVQRSLYVTIERVHQVVGVLNKTSCGINFMCVFSSIGKRLL